MATPCLAVYLPLMWIICKNCENGAARLIYQVNKCSSVTPLIRELHWLPVEQRIKFKISVYVYYCVYGSSPVYLQDLISKYNSGCQGLRSNRDHTRVTIPKTKRAFGDKYFAVFGPKLWNSLPGNLREAPSVQCFKKNS